VSIDQFIASGVLAPRLSQSQVLVVYDPDRRYRDICLTMASDNCVVVDTTESSIESRIQAVATLRQIGSQSVDHLLVYVPTAKPLDDEAKQGDPFALYAAVGAVFPDGDGDNYLSLCLKAKPDHATQIRQLFAQDPAPSFDVIDAIGGGLGWPNLRAVLRVESAREILLALLRPTERQLAALKDNDVWSVEAKELLKCTLGLCLKTRGKTWSPIADELWRFMLFSEFAFDLPGELPTSLQGVPCALEASRPLVEDLCERLRSDGQVQNTYIQRAEAIEQELGLREVCESIHDLGERDTFPFEERAFLRAAMEALLASKSDRARQVQDAHSHSVWTGRGESQVQWDLLRSALDLMETCSDSERALSGHAQSMETLVDFYVAQLREVDRLHREFEQAVSDYEWQDTQGMMQPLQKKARDQYGRLMERVQVLFTQHLQQVGWPLANRLSNANVFDSFVAPKLLQGGNRVAYIMVDALRYELGLALEQQLSEDGVVDLKPALAQLPTTTPVGMAGLLPEAGAGLSLERAENKISPSIHGQPVGTVTQRMGVFQKRYGQRFQEGRLEDLVRSRIKISCDVDLLVLRSVEIDNQFENDPDLAPTEIISALRRIRFAVHKLKDAGFSEVVIATDHGFFMNTHAGPGDTCAKLPGDWINVHDRSLLGDGSTDNQHYLLSAEKAGIRGDFKSMAGPLTLASYQAGMQYYHGGASLQECIVPVITLHLETAHAVQEEPVAITLSYKNGAKRVTTRLPVLELSVVAKDLFPHDRDYEILIEAYDAKGDVVGEAKHGGRVDAAAGTLTLRPGSKAQVTLKMQMEFEGKFKVKALNPSTMIVYDQLDLETDYTV
jgi:hypothetical protein